MLDLYIYKPNIKKWGENIPLNLIRITAHLYHKAVHGGLLQYSLFEVFYCTKCLARLCAAN